MGTQVSCSSPHHSSTPVRNSLLGASLHSFCSTRVVPNLTAKLQGHRGVAFIHCQDGHLVLGGALNHSQGADLRLKVKVMVSAARVPPDPNTPWLTLQREKGREPWHHCTGHRRAQGHSKRCEVGTDGLVGTQTWCTAGRNTLL